MGLFVFTIMNLESYCSHTTKLELTESKRTNQIELKINNSVDASVVGHVQLTLTLEFDGQYIFDMDKKSAVNFFTNCFNLLK